MSAVLVSQASVANAQSENNSQVNYGQLINIESTIEEIKTKTQNTEEINSKEAQPSSENKELNLTELTVDEVQKDTQTPEGINSKVLETLPENKDLNSNVLTLEEVETNIETLPEETVILPEKTDSIAEVLTTEETLPEEVENKKVSTDPLTDEQIKTNAETPEEIIPEKSILEEVSAEEMNMELTRLADENVVGKTYGEVFNDQRIAKRILDKLKITNIIYENGKITNQIAQDDIDKFKYLDYRADDGDYEPVKLGGLQNFKNITNVSIYKANVEMFPEALLELPNLITINLIGTTFDEANAQYKPKPAPFELPERLKDLKNLKNLSLNNTRITEIPSWITEMTTLVKLNLVGSNIYTDNENFLLPEDIEKLVNLNTLEISNNNMKKLPDNLHLLENLKTFRFVYNGLEELSDENYEFIKSRGTKYVFDQWVVKQGGVKDISEDINIEMHPIVDFLLKKGELPEQVNEEEFKFYIYEYNQDYSEIISKTELSKNDVYSQDEKFTVSKDKVEKDKNYRFLALNTEGLFDTSYFNYYFNTVEKPEVPEVPEVIEHEIEEPEIMEPEVEEPAVMEPEIEKPETMEPEVEGPQISVHEVEEPAIMEPEVEKPEVEEPEVMIPEKVQPEEVMAEKINSEKIVMPFRNGMLPKAGEKNSNLLSIAMLFIITSIGSLFALLRKKI